MSYRRNKPQTQPKTGDQMEHDYKIFIKQSTNEENLSDNWKNNEFDYTGEETPDDPNDGGEVV